MVRSQLQDPYYCNQKNLWLDCYVVEESLVTVQNDSTAHVSLVNLTGFTQTIDNGTTVGTVSEAEEEIQFAEDADKVIPATVNQLVSTD